MMNNGMINERWRLSVIVIDMTDGYISSKDINVLLIVYKPVRGIA